MQSLFRWCRQNVNNKHGFVKKKQINIFNGSTDNENGIFTKISTGNDKRMFTNYSNSDE